MFEPLLDHPWRSTVSPIRMPCSSGQLHMSARSGWLSVQTPVGTWIRVPVAGHSAARQRPACQSDRLSGLGGSPPRGRSRGGWPRLPQGWVEVSANHWSLQSEDGLSRSCWSEHDCV
jgi:hypothetical protein